MGLSLAWLGRLKHKTQGRYLTKMRSVDLFNSFLASLSRAGRLTRSQLTEFSETEAATAAGSQLGRDRIQCSVDVISVLYLVWLFWNPISKQSVLYVLMFYETEAATAAGSQLGRDRIQCNV